MSRAKPLPVMTLETDGFSCFSVSWTDAAGRYHVWIRLADPRAVAKGIPAVVVEDTLYMNPLGNPKYRDTAAGWFETRKLDLTAKKHAATRAAIVELAEPETLVALQTAERDARDAAERMHSEAWTLNRLFDAVALIRKASADDLAAVMVNQSSIVAARAERLRRAFYEPEFGKPE